MTSPSGVHAARATFPSRGSIIEDHPSATFIGMGPGSHAKRDGRDDDRNMGDHFVVLADQLSSAWATNHSPPHWGGVRLFEPDFLRRSSSKPAYMDLWRGRAVLEPLDDAERETHPLTVAQQRVAPVPPQWAGATLPPSGRAPSFSRQMDGAT